jgi:hypothetical protein
MGIFSSTEGFENISRTGKVEDGNRYEDNTLLKALNEFAESVRNFGTLSQLEKDNFPSKEALEKKYEGTWSACLWAEFAKLAGFPIEFYQEMKTLPEIQQLTKFLLAMALVGNDQLINFMSVGHLGASGRYRLPQILIVSAHNLKLVFSDANKLDLLSDLLSGLILEEHARKEFAARYLSVVEAAVKWARSKGIERENLFKYLALASQTRNNPQPALNYKYADMKYWLDIYVKHPGALPRAIVNAIHASKRNFRNVAPFTLVLSESETGKGEVKQRFFDLRSGRLGFNLIPSPYGDLMRPTTLTKAVQSSCVNAVKNIVP